MSDTSHHFSPPIIIIDSVENAECNEPIFVFINWKNMRSEGFNNYASEKNV